MTRPYLIFILGWASKRAWARAWVEHLRPGLVEHGMLTEGAREGRDYDVFGWAPRFELPASMVRSTAAAAKDLARLVQERQNVTVLGHSKGGNLALEYLVQVADGRIEPPGGLSRVISMNAPLDSWGGWVARGHLRKTRLVELQSRLAGRGIAPRIDVVYDPTDPIACPLDVPGISCRAHACTSGPHVAGGRWRSLMVWSPNHLACSRAAWPKVLSDLP